MIRKKILSIVLIMVLCLVQIPTISVSAAEVSVCYVNDDTGSDTNTGDSETMAVATMAKALELVAEGGTIIVCSDLLIADSSGVDAPWLLDKKVSIVGNGDSFPTISLRASGILLGADVCFEKVQIESTTLLRPGIAANGHRLELINVKNGSTSIPLQIYGGTFIDANDGTDYGESDRGTESEIIISGGNYEAVYAGSVNGNIDIPVSIHVSKGSGLTLGGIYAGSTLKNPSDESTAGKAPVLDSAITLSQNVDVSVSENAPVKVVDAVNESNMVSLSVSGSGWYSYTLKHIDELTVHSGTFAPASDSIFGNATNTPNIILTGSENDKATLDVSECVGDNNSIIFTDFTGSAHGIIVLNQEHILKFTGMVTGGPTEFRLSGGMPWSSADNPGYSGWIEYNTTYISGGTGNGTFVISNPYATQTDIAFTESSCVANGWTTIEEVEMTPPELIDIEFASKTVTYEEMNNVSGIEIEMTATFSEEEELPYAYLVPLDYKITYTSSLGAVTEYAQQSSILDESESYYYCPYTMSTSSSVSENVLMTFEPYEDVLVITKGESGVAAGAYVITVSVETSMGTITKSFTLTVQAEDGSQQPENPSQPDEPDEPQDPDEPQEPDNPDEPEDENYEKYLEQIEEFLSKNGHEIRGTVAFEQRFKIEE